jgi:hypothetical protein
MRLDSMTDVALMKIVAPSITEQENRRIETVNFFLGASYPFNYFRLS